jgi:adenine-specific DNA-methyltransferase
MRLPLDVANSTGTGFKVFKLTSSNFETWHADETPKDAAGLADQLELYADHLVLGRSQLDVLYELLLKAGLPLTARVEEREAAGLRVFSVADGLLLVCLEDPVTQDALRAMMALKPERVICLDHAFQGNDQLKANTVLEMKSHGIEFRTA